MNVVKGLLLAIGLVAASVSAASAMPYATVVEDYNQGTGITEAGRTNTANAIGPANGTFLSLGVGGSAIFSFGAPFMFEASIIEITNGSRPSHFESALVYVGNVLNEMFTGIGTTWTALGPINNQGAGGLSTISFAGGPFLYLAIVDTSPVPPGQARDGFDIDAVRVAPVPVPAGVALLGSGLAALGFFGWRRKRTSAAVAA